MLSQNVLCPHILVATALDAIDSQSQWAGEKTRRLQYQVWELFCATVSKNYDKYL